MCVRLFRHGLLQLLLLPCIKHALDESKNLIQNICVSPGSPYSPVYLTSIDASGSIPKLVFCTNWVSLSSSLQNQESQRWVYWKSHLCWRKISLFGTSWRSTYLGFLPLSLCPSLLSVGALAGRKTRGYPLKSMHTRQLLSRLCQPSHSSPPWGGCQHSNCAGEHVSFWCHFFGLLDLLLLMQQNCHQV